ncbi:MAG: sugar transferase [Armatimonadota bacterium]
MNYVLWKRIFDLCGAALLLAATLPLWGVIAVLLLATQGRPVLFRHRRVGADGRPFDLLKFRTLRDGPSRQLPDQPMSKAAAESRVTPAGRFLRRFALDELPQVLNVLRGEMSMIGPRPMPEEDLAQLVNQERVPPGERARRLDWASRRQTVLPGVTGLWQITVNDEADFENWIVSDLAYVERQGLLLDAYIAWYTPLAILRGRDRRQRAQSKQMAEMTELGPPT